jgi:hypothetical protein
MALTKGFARNNAKTPLDQRLADMATIVCNADGSPRTGVLGSANPSIVSALATWHFRVQAAEFVTSKGKADGVMIYTNDGVVDVPIAAGAPASNSRIDVLWTKHEDNTTGDAASLPIFGVTSGAAAASPVKPAIPTGAEELATLRAYSGTTGASGGANILTNTYRMTAARGGVVPARTLVELQAWANPVVTQRAEVLANSKPYEYNVGAWRPTTFSIEAKTGTTVLTASTLTTAVSVNLPADAPAGDYLVSYSVITDTGGVGSRFHRVAWDAAELTSYIADYMSSAPAGGLYAADSMRKLAHAGGAASVVLQVQVNATGPIFRYARIVVTYIGPS